MILDLPYDWDGKNYGTEEPTIISKGPHPMIVIPHPTNPKEPDIMILRIPWERDGTMIGRSEEHFRGFEKAGHAPSRVKITEDPPATP